MNLQALLATIRQAAGYQALLETLQRRESPAGALNLLRAARPAIAAALAEDLHRPVLYVASRSDRLLTLSEELPLWSPSLPILAFPDPNPLFYEIGPWGPRTLRQRVHVLAHLTAADAGAQSRAWDQNPAPILLSAPRALMTRTIPPPAFRHYTQSIQVAGNTPLDLLLEQLVRGGYQPASVVTEPGQFGRRGGILDLWPPAENLPVRIEFFGDEVESMRRFDPATQRSSERLDQLRVTPAREGLPDGYDSSWDRWLPEEAPEQPNKSEAFLEYFLPWMHAESAGLVDFLPEDALIVLDDRAGFEAAVEELETQALHSRQARIKTGELPPDAPLPYLTLAALQDAFADRQLIDFGLLGSPAEIAPALAGLFQPGARFGGRLEPVLLHLAESRQAHDQTIVVSRQAPRLAELWSDEDGLWPVIDELPADLQPGDLHFIHGGLSEGWVMGAPAGGRLQLLTDAEIFGWSQTRPRPRRRSRAETPEAQFSDLHAGDWVVHIDYGIGRFRELVERTLDEVRREFLLIEYAGGDEVYVPIHQADRVTRYVGANAAPPSLSRLGTQEWERAKGRAREAVHEVARDLLDLYATRMTISGHAFSPDSDWQRELEASFPYEETEDQLRALAEVKRDLERPRPMDRLICGDAGYGKTEVALRAAFKTVMDGTQVAMLVPTTVLAQQHFHTFQQRLSAFPVQVEMLSRFRTPVEAATILTRLQQGEIDILIGTHRMLQPDVDFKNLGLLIIDEEQRFGVTHKEHFKRLRTEIDVLTLTATPIPRTLYMALTGARDISTINTPPEERLPVVTHVGRYDPQLARQAILRELDRGGQVFFVHNRVQTIGAARARVEKIVPQARLAIAHGQMPEKELAEVMERFAAGEIDVLVSTSIIESGLDIPNANTLIVDRAEMFGLAQLYQLRGRVGRSAARGYAYFFRHAHFRPTQEALSRLETIAEYANLGAGYSIAMKDLEIRGAGEVLGTRQHGHIASIGFHLYTRLLSQAVHDLREAYDAKLPLDSQLPVSREPLPIAIDLPLPSAIPDSYIQDRELRLQIYRRIADLRESNEIEGLTTELIDRFGPLPHEVLSLLYQLRIKLLASRARVRAVSHLGGQILVELPEPEETRPLPELGPDVRRSKRGLWLRIEGEGWQERLEDVLMTVARVDAARHARPA